MQGDDILYGDGWVAGNEKGEAITLALLSDLRTEANDFFQAYYGLPDEERFRIGGDLPLYGGVSLSSADYLNHPNFILGTLLNDTGTGGRIVTHDPGISFGAGEDIVHGGLGDDRIMGSSGDDLIDGGEGTDTLDYSDVDGAGVTVRIEEIESENAFYPERIVIERNDLFGFQDYAYGVEKFILTPFKDTLTINAADIERYGNEGQKEIHFDGGENNDPADSDTADFSDVEGGVKINHGTVEGTNIHLERFEEYIGTVENDTFRNLDSGTQIITKEGEDRVSISKNILVTDASADDRIVYIVDELHGGDRWKQSESPWAYGVGGVSYGAGAAGHPA